MLTVAQRVLRFLTHLRVDPESDDLLERHVEALTAPAEAAGQIAYSDRPLLHDPRIAPLRALPFAAQYTGGTLPPRRDGEDDDAYLERARAEVVRPRGMRRGGEGSLRDLVTARLSGSRYVQIVERYGGDEWETLVIVLQDEVDDLDELNRVCNAPDVVVAGEHVTVRADVGWTIAQMESAYAGQTIADFETDFTSIFDLESNRPAQP